MSSPDELGEKIRYRARFQASLSHSIVHKGLGTRLAKAVFSSDHMKASISYVLRVLRISCHRTCDKKIEFNDQGDTTKLNEFRVPQFRRNWPNYSVSHLKHGRKSKMVVINSGGRKARFHWKKENNNLEEQGH